MANKTSTLLCALAGVAVSVALAAPGDALARKKRSEEPKGTPSWINANGEVTDASQAEEGYGQTVQGIIARIAPRLAAVLGQKLAAQATPVFGALAGASINYTFARYYQEIARVHFGVLRLSQETGLPREALTEALRLRIEQLQDDRIERRVRKV